MVGPVVDVDAELDELGVYDVGVGKIQLTVFCQGEPPPLLVSAEIRMWLYGFWFRRLDADIGVGEEEGGVGEFEVGRKLAVLSAGTAGRVGNRFGILCGSIVFLYGICAKIRRGKGDTGQYEEYDTISHSSQ